MSDTFCRTVKYLLGLALAVPCVSYDWINDNIKQVRRGGERRGEKKRGGERKRRGEGGVRGWIWFLSYGIVPFCVIKFHD